MELPKGAERRIQEASGTLVPFVLVPAPPSTNNLFRTVVSKGRVFRVTTSDYKDWKAEAEGPVRMLRSPVTYPVGVRLTLCGKWYKARDVDNVAKPIIDLLVSVGVLAGDNLNHVVGLTLRCEPSEAPPQVKVEIEETAPSLFGSSPETAK